MVEQGTSQRDAAVAEIERLTAGGEGAQLGAGARLRDLLKWLNETFPDLKETNNLAPPVNNLGVRNAR